MKKMLLMAGTRKGGLIFTGNARRQKWEAGPLQFKAWNVMHMTADQRSGRLHAAAVHDVFGPSTHYSDDLGETWTQAEKSPAIERPSASGRPIGVVSELDDMEAAKAKPEKMVKIWNIRPGRENEPDVLYAGAQPASLFKSTDDGVTWEIVPGFYDHPHRGSWFPGAGGLTLHTILPHPTDPDRMWVGISTGGCYYTQDGGATWTPRNKNVLADFSPDKYPEYGQCLHKMTFHPSNPERLYQQNHCGMYRSDDGGLSWIDIGEGKLPTRFGFPIAVHPHDPDTIYIAPQESDQFRLNLEDRFTVWRSNDRGESWKALRSGLPKQTFVVVLREAMATDSFENAGIYVGTTTGQIFYSRDNGDAWELLADYLPPIYSLETAVLE